MQGSADTKNQTPGAEHDIEIAIPRRATSAHSPQPITPKGQLPRHTALLVLLSCWFVVGALFALSGSGSSGLANFNIAGTIVLGCLLFITLITVLSWLVEGRRRAIDRVVTALVTGAFLIALLPLISVIYTVTARGLERFDFTFFSRSMRNVTDAAQGGALHAIVGTLEITGLAVLISVPIGLMTAVYLVEYGRGWLARAVTFLVDVMTGIPSIVAGLFAYALFVLFFGPGVRMGIGGAIALSLLMIPIVVRSSEEMLKLVPDELREASYALGVPKWLTVLKVVIPTAIGGIATGVTLAISRVIGETAPLLIIAGFTASMNYDPFDGRMQTLPVFVFTSFRYPGQPVQASLDLAWTGALTLIVIVMVLNLLARLIARYFAPRTGRR